jgi:CheY-like chemotaxis protein
MKKVLIIDDSEVNLYLINAIFEESEEVEVILESNSKKALQSVRRSMPDLIILDLMMPYVDGFQILYQLKTDPSLSEIPVMVISARHDEEAIQQTSDYGVVDYIKKPINLKDIEQRIKQILDLVVH